MQIGKITKLDQEDKNPKPSAALQFFFDSSPPSTSTPVYTAVLLLQFFLRFQTNCKEETRNNDSLSLPSRFGITLLLFFIRSSSCHHRQGRSPSRSVDPHTSFVQHKIFIFSPRSFSLWILFDLKIFLLRFSSDFPLSPEVVLSLDPLRRFDLKYFFSGSLQLQVQNSESL
ncbi:hypothetical protein SLEP1_g58204 [Rubroshorea leprosula]|uniref:Uncharacterized protein n=1 Tax=Rubroshorea leprosula TaxID=152421 RepID=A0AAV5MSL7_9ROSI|nr:hypothetical protein SLEP1_g58204 [Rubroshorea leprosula]